MVVKDGFSRKTKCRFKNLLLQTIVLISFMGSLTATAQVYTVANGNASFDAATPVSSYQGKSNKLQGSIDFATKKISFSVPVESITTNNEKRDKHMYELIMTGKNPDVILEGMLTGDFDFDKNTAQTVQAEGNFTLAGTTNEVSIPIVLTSKEEGLQMTASWSLQITDYNLERPSFMFIKVKDKHDLNVNAILNKK
jgi:polyisoprenoid-binding protein YceI